jgi:hypothetical protein
MEVIGNLVIKGTRGVTLGVLSGCEPIGLYTEGNMPSLKISIYSYLQFAFYQQTNTKINKNACTLLLLNDSQSCYPWDHHGLTLNAYREVLITPKCEIVIAPQCESIVHRTTRSKKANQPI